jgi:hypothetical protein
LIWSAIIFSCVLAGLILVRLLLRGRERLRAKAAGEKPEYKRILNFQELVLTAGVIGLFFNILGLQLNRESLAGSIESNEVRNRPYVYIGDVEKRYNEDRTAMLCVSEVANSGPVPGFDFRFSGKIKIGEKEFGGRKIKAERYGAIYPGQALRPAFLVPIGHGLPVDVEIAISYDDYRPYHYEYTVTLLYNPDFDTLRVTKCDEKITAK